MRTIHRIGFLIWRVGCGIQRIGHRLQMLGRPRASEHRDENGVDTCVTYAGP